MKTLNNKERNIPDFTTEDLIKVGAHIGHRVSARLPKMRPYIYGESNGIHLIDARRTAYSLSKSLNVLYDAAANGQRILFVSTNNKWSDLIAGIAKKSGQYYVTKWRGGMMTNWRTIVSAIKSLKAINKQLESIEKDPSSSDLKKKEVVKLRLKKQKLDKYFVGILNMSGMPDLIVVLSTKDEDLAIKEAKCVGIPVMGICDTNSNPDLADYLIPANDDSLKAFEFLGGLFITSILNGSKEWLGSSKSAVKKPAAKKADEKPASKKPAAKKPATKKAAEKPATKKAAEKPAAKKADKKADEAK